MTPASRLDLVFGERIIVHRRCGGYVTTLNIYADNLMCGKCRRAWRVHTVMHAMSDAEIGEVFGMIMKLAPPDVLVVACEDGRQFVKTVDEAEAEDPKYERWTGL